MRLLSLLFAVGLAACADDEPAPAVDVAPAVVPAADARQTVYDLASVSPRLSTFAALVEAAEVDAILRDTAQVFTVFAPSNSAFDALGAETLDALRSDPDRARALLLAHVLPTRMLSGDIFGGIGIESSAGPTITLDASGESVTLTDETGTQASVIEADLDAENGVLHIIDAVLAAPSS